VKVETMGTEVIVGARLRTRRLHLVSHLRLGARRVVDAVVALRAVDVARLAEVTVETLELLEMVLGIED
jgi:hypothetical protein